MDEAMFTGLIEQMGRVRRIDRRGREAALWIDCSLASLREGESIAVDGACLTVQQFDDSGFRADASSETMQKTTLGDRRPTDRVHLERAVRVGDPLGGHIVTGHVDGVGRLVSRQLLGDSEKVVFEVPRNLESLVAPKGSVAVDGVSLTVNDVQGPRLEVMLVPFTRGATTFDERPVGGGVNIEVDVLAKYVARLMGKPGVG